MSNNRTDSNDKDIDEIMKIRFGTSCIFKLEEERDQGSWFEAHKKQLFYDDSTSSQLVRKPC